MFTGIVTDIGTVETVERRGDLRLTIACGYDMDAVTLGASIACSGVCLTVVDKAPGRFMVDLSAETLSRTASSWEAGRRLNLERALKVGDELGGHIVTGHVDGIGTVQAVAPEGDSIRLAVGVGDTLAPYLAEKGSVTIDGVSLTVGNRVLLKNQTTATQNGIYIFQGAAVTMTRATDADSNSEVTSQLAVSVEEGSTNANTTWRLATPDPIVLGTTNLTFQLFSSTYYAVPSKNNKNMVASVTTADFQSACATGISATPAQGGFVEVEVNGLNQVVGDGVKTTDCYFSADGGTTAKAIGSIASGDILYWVGSVAGFQLSAADRISFNYNV